MEVVKRARLNAISHGDLGMIAIGGVMLMMTRRVLVSEQNGVIDAFRQKARQRHDEQKLQEVQQVSQKNAEKSSFLVIFVDASEEFVEILDVVPFSFCRFRRLERQRIRRVFIV